MARTGHRPPTARTYSDTAARLYAGEARKFAAAELMTKYSLAGQTYWSKQTIRLPKV